MSVQSITSMSTQTPEEITFEEFNKKFPAPTKVSVHLQVCGHNCRSSQDPIVVTDLNVSITVFEIEKFRGKIKGISSYHYKNGTEVKEIEKELNYSIINNYDYEYYLIEGKGALAALQHNIVLSIKNFFSKEMNSESTYKIVSDLNPNRDSTLQYVTASLDLSGKLLYCRHP